ncbi:circularly permuted type 2 ATP-grasp protein [Thalassoglobus sp. JC818]|uniref:circularly permuted type 2 ATP-grasp protein n=1 Tax=Thalassoglobus sp. JC818 TaxID=3232136 RepID=UPI0034593105
MSSVLPQKSMSGTYSPAAGVFDEAFDRQAPRPHWKQLWDRVDQLGAAELQRRTTQAEHLLNENGVTFGGVTDSSGNQRPWKLDLIPMILDEKTWAFIEEGIEQRAKLQNLLIRDIYGDLEAVQAGILPPEVVYGHNALMFPAKGLHIRENSLVLYSAELARSESGKFWVMADRSNAPAGAGFALENRIVTKRILPQLSNSFQIRKLAPFFVKLKATLKALSPRKIDHPRVAILSNGPTHPYYFEDVYLARYLGIDLVQGSDLAVREDQVFLKTLAGLINVDVLLVRGDEGDIDPVECGGGAPHGVPGLLQAIRSGTVALANMPGSGIIESPVFKSVLPKLCQFYLGTTLKIPSIATWWCGDASSREYVLDNMRSLVIKPAFRASGGEEVIGESLSAEEQNQLRKRILSQPNSYVAQELIRRSAAPTLNGEAKLTSGHVAMRVFAVASEDSYSVMPGGLVRVADSSGPMELSIAGGETSKDLWVETSSPERSMTLLAGEHRNVQLHRTTAKFPSRVADDLFWLGQNLDRSDQLSRLCRALLSRVHISVDTDNDATSVLLRSLVDVGSIEPGFVVNGLVETLPKLHDSLPAIIVDSSQSRGLGQSVTELLRLCSLVRDWISPETWQQLHRTASDFQDAISGTNDLAEFADELDDLILGLASAMGLIDNGMIRGPAWRFLDLGRRIERSRTTAQFARSVLDSDARHDPATLKMVIEVCDVQMTYRARYLDDIQQNGVFDLCITDLTNPRSILSQLESIAGHVAELPGSTVDPLRTEETRLAMSAVHQVKMLTSDDLGAMEPIRLVSVLDIVDQAMRDLASLLERKYLLHSGDLRQIVDQGGVLS